MMTERVKMKYVSCPACDKQLFKVSGKEARTGSFQPMLYGYGSVEKTEESNVTAEIFIDTIKQNELVAEPSDWAEAPEHGI